MNNTDNHIEAIWITLCKLVVFLIWFAVYLNLPDSNWKIALGITLILYTGLLLIIPLANYQLDRLIERREWIMTIQSITPETILTDRKIELVKERERLATTIRFLSGEHVKFGQMLILEEPLFSINGEFVAWKVGGVAIPVFFAQDWWEAYEQQQTVNPEFLPSISSFQGTDERSREVQREYVRAINEKLQNLQVVRSPGSQYPARWIISDEKIRMDALSKVGIITALRFCTFVSAEMERL